MDGSLTIAICGTGGMAARMVAAMRRVPGLGPGPVISASAARAEAFAAAHGLPGTAPDAAAAARAGARAVYVANRASGHADSARAAIAAGLPVLVEKPFALTAAEVEAVLAEAAARGVLVMEAIWVLALPAWRALRAAAAAGALGAPRHLSVRFALPMDRAGWPGLFDPAEGGVLADRAVYGLAPALDLFGAAEALQALAVPGPEGGDVSALLQLRHAGGATSQAALSVAAGAENDLRLSCAGGSLDLAPWLPAERLVWHPQAPIPGAAPGPGPEPGQGAAQRLKRALRAQPALRRLAALRPPRAQVHGYGADQYAPMLAHFAETLRAGRTESDWIPHRLSRDIARLTDRARTEANRP